MSANTIATAYVQVMPSMEGVSGVLSGSFTKEVNSAAKGAEGGFSIIKGSLSMLVSQGLMAVANGLKNLGMDVISTGREFDSAMSQVAATMGVTVDEIGNLRDFAQEMGSTTAFSATEAAEALNYMALAGYDAETSMSMLPNVLNLAAAGGIDLAYASDMVTDAASALGLKIDETTVMVDQMAMASSKSNASVEQFGEAILKIGATARNVAGGTQELTTVLGVLADNGIKGAEGGTHLRNMLLSLQSAAVDGAVNFGDFSVAVYDSEGNMRSMVDIIGDMQAGMADMSQESKDAMISGVFNKTDLASVNALLNTSRDRFDELTEAIEGSAGAAQEMANTQLDNLEGDITLFKSALEGAQIAISDGLTPTLRDFVQLGSSGLSEVTQAFKAGGLSEAMKAFGDWLGELVVKVTETLPKMVEAGGELLISLVSGISQNLPQVVTAAVEVIESLSSTIFELLPMIVEAGVQIIITLAQGLAEMAPELIPATVEAILTIVDTLIDNLDLLIEAAVQLAVGIGVGLVEAIPQIVERIPEIITGIVEALISAGPEVAEAGETLLSAIVENIGSVVSTVGQGVGEIIAGILSVISGAWSSVVNAGMNLLNGIINGIGSVIANVKGAVLSIISNIISTLSGAVSRVVAAGQRLLNGIIRNISSVISNVRNAVLNIISSIVSTLSGGVSRMVNVGYNLIMGIKQGILNAASNVISAVSNFASDVISTAKGIFGISSPSKIFKEFGEFLDIGLAQGIAGLAHKAIEAAEDMSAGVGDAIKTDYAMNIGVNGSTSGNTMTTPYYGDITINVYGSENQDVNELAVIVSERIQRMINRKEAVYA